jgi:hypothetical protein
VCPFAWITSKWIRTMAAQRDYAMDWRFISLRLINADVAGLNDPDRRTYDLLAGPTARERPRRRSPPARTAW